MRTSTEINPNNISCEQTILRVSNVWLREDGIFEINIVNNEIFSKSDALELIEAAGIIGRGSRMANLIIVGEFTIAENDARSLSCSVIGSRYKKADAFVITSFCQRIIANMYMNINKPCVPTRFFNDRSDAEAWLKQFI